MTLKIQPGTNPEWATNEEFPAGDDPWSEEPTKVEPSAGEKAAGFEPGKGAAAAHVNWTLGNLSDHVTALSCMAAQNWFPLFEMGDASQVHYFRGRNGLGGEQIAAASGRTGMLAFIDAFGVPNVDRGRLFVSPGLGMVPLHNSTTGLSQLVLRDMNAWSDYADCAFGLKGSSERLLAVRYDAGGIYSYTYGEMYSNDAEAGTLEATLSQGYNRIHYSLLYGRWYAARKRKTGSPSWTGELQSAEDSDISSWAVQSWPGTGSWANRGIRRFIDGHHEADTEAGQVLIAISDIEAGFFDTHYMFTENGETWSDSEIDSGLSNYWIAGIAYSYSHNRFGCVVTNGTTGAFYLSNSSNPADGWTQQSTWAESTTGATYDVAAIGNCWVVSLQRRFRISYDNGVNWSSMAVPWLQACSAIDAPTFPGFESRAFQRLLPYQNRVLGLMAGVPVHTAAESAESDCSQHMHIISSLSVGQLFNH